MHLVSLYICDDL